MQAPRCFVSYSWDDPDHQRWVWNLVAQLRHHGVEAIFDQGALQPGDDLTAWMEAQVREASVVLIVCTPRLAEKAKQRGGGVAFERRLLAAGALAGNERRVIPLLRRGEPDEAVPGWLAGQLWVDFRDEAGFVPTLDKLLRAIWDAPQVALPAVGRRPVWSETAPPKEALPGSLRWDDVGEPILDDRFGEGAALTGAPKFTFAPGPTVRVETASRGLVLHHRGNAGEVDYQWLTIAKEGIDLDLRNAPIYADISMSGPGSAGLLYRFDVRSRNYVAFTLGERRLYFWRRDPEGVALLHDLAIQETGRVRRLGVHGRGDEVDVYLDDQFVRTYRAVGADGTASGVVLIGEVDATLETLRVYPSPGS